MEEKETKFSYLGKTVSAPVLKCTECGQIFMPEEFVNGKVKQMEKSLEEK